MQDKKNLDKFEGYLKLVMNKDVEGFKKAVRKDKNLHLYRRNGKSLMDILKSLKNKGLAAQFMQILIQHRYCSKEFSKEIKPISIVDQLSGKKALQFVSAEDKSNMLKENLLSVDQDEILMLIKDLIEKKADLDESIDKDGLTILHYTALRKADKEILILDGETKRTTNVILDYEIIKKLVSAGADINIRDSKGNTPLMAAIVGKNIVTLNALLEFNADIYIRNNAGKNALELAIFYFFIDAIIALCEKNESINKNESKNYVSDACINMLKMSADNGNFKKCLEVLSQMFLMKNVIKQDQTMLLYLISLKIIDIPAVKKVLETEIDVNVVDSKNHGRTALWQAADLGNIELVTLLLQHSAQDIPDEDNVTAVKIAGQKGHSEIAALIEKILTEREAALLPLPELPPVEKSDDKALEGHAKNIDSLKLEIKGKIGDLESEILGGFSTLLKEISKNGKIKKYLSDLTHFIVSEKNIFLEKIEEFKKNIKFNELIAATSVEQEKIIAQLNQIKVDLSVFYQDMQNNIARCDGYISHPDRLKDTSTAEILTQSKVTQKPKKKKATTAPQKIKVEEKKKSPPSVREQQKSTKPVERKINIDISSSRFFSLSLDRAKRNLKIRKQKETLNYAIELIEAFEKNVFLIGNNSKVNPLSATSIRYLQEAIIFSIVQSLRFRYAGEDRRAQQLDALRHVFISKRGKLDFLNDADLAMIYSEFTQYIRDLWGNPRDVPILNEKGKLNHLMVETSWSLTAYKETNISDLRGIISLELDQLSDTQEDVSLVKKLLEDYLQKITNPMMKREDFSQKERKILYKEKIIGDEKRHNQNYLADIHARFFTPRELAVSKAPILQESSEIPIVGGVVV